MPSRAAAASYVGLEQNSGMSPVSLALSIAGLLIVFFFVLGLILLATNRLFAGWVALLTAVLVASAIGLAYLRLAQAKVKAIRLGQREVDLFFGFAKLVLWEQNEGLLFLKNKRVSAIVYGPDDGGGTKLIFPVFGDELKLHLPLTLQMCWFKDHGVVTRESIRLFMKLAIWWRVKDKRGIEDFYRLINKEIHSGTDDSIPEVIYAGPDLGRNTTRGTRRTELIVAEKWIQTLAESCLRPVSRHDGKLLQSRISSATMLAVRAFPVSACHRTRAYPWRLRFAVQLATRDIPRPMPSPARRSIANDAGRLSSSIRPLKSCRVLSRRAFPQRRGVATSGNSIVRRAGELLFSSGCLLAARSRLLWL
jgi:hypothetical protein